MFKRKEQGLASITICLFLIGMIAVLLAFTLYYKMVSLTKAKLDDGLTASTLAAVIYDAREYAKDGKEIIDTDRSYDAFIDTLKVNLDLDDNLQAINSVYYTSVVPQKFIIYNVVDDDITVMRYGSTGAYNINTYTDSLGKIYSENGELVTCSAVYTQLAVTIEGLWGSDEKTVYVESYIALDER